jgi:hypothetical protein
MLYREIIAVSSEIHTKRINILCGQNVEFVNGEYKQPWMYKQLIKTNPLLRLQRRPQTATSFFETASQEKRKLDGRKIDCERKWFTKANTWSVTRVGGRASSGSGGEIGPTTYWQAGPLSDWSEVLRRSRMSQRERATEQITLFIRELTSSRVFSSWPAFWMSVGKTVSVPASSRSFR